MPGPGGVKPVPATLSVPGRTPAAGPNPWRTAMIKLLRPLLRITLPAAVVLLAGCSSGGTPTDNGIRPEPCTFRNPVGVGQDPYVTRYEGWYYFIESRDNGLWVSRSQKLTELKANAVKVWTPPASGWNRTHLWAPELHPLDGRWYIYYAAGESGPPFIYQRTGVLESVGADAQGQYLDRGIVYTGDGAPGSGENVWAIDMTVERLNGQLYAVWSGWERNAATDKTVQHLYIAKMSNPWTISSPRVKLSSPVESWEVGTELSLNEGAQFLTRNGQTFIIYSTRESWLKEYRLGQLRLAPGADPMSPTSWTKSGPVFQGTGDVYGVGHASFTKSPDGTEDWIVYHTKISTTPGWERQIHLQEFTWNADGSPNFGTPTSPSRLIPQPSGQCSAGVAVRWSAPGTPAPATLALAAAQPPRAREFRGTLVASGSRSTEAARRHRLGRPGHVAARRP